MKKDNFDFPEGITEEQLQEMEELSKSYKIESKNFYNNELKGNPPIPPWLKYPGRSRYSMFWRMGDGEHYLMKYVWTYFDYSTQEELKKYKEKYPEPEDWRGWYDMQKI